METQSPIIDLSLNTNFVNQDISLTDFGSFKKELIATTGYSIRNVIVEGVLSQFNSRLIKGEKSRINVSFYCNDYVKSVFDRHCKTGQDSFLVYAKSLENGSFEGWSEDEVKGYKTALKSLVEFYTLNKKIHPNDTIRG